MSQMIVYDVIYVLTYHEDAPTRACKCL